MFNEILIGGIFLVLAVLVQIIGTIFADKRNHERNLERLRNEHGYKLEYLRERIFYNKRISYLERICFEVEKRQGIYSTILFLFLDNLEEVISVTFKTEKPKKLVNKNKIKVIEKVVEEIKGIKEMEKFLPRGNSIYLENQILDKLISEFILTDTAIIMNIENAQKKKEIIINLVKKNVEIGNNIVIEIKKELKI